jgi:hypothetical protein
MNSYDWYVSLFDLITKGDRKTNTTLWCTQERFNYYVLYHQFTMCAKRKHTTHLIMMKNENEDELLNYLMYLRWEWDL